MTGFWQGEEEEIVHLKLTPTVWESGQVELVENAAAKLKTQVRVHLKVDTGMGRLVSLGYVWQAVCSTLKSSPHVVCEGLSTHLASSEILDAPSVEEQIAISKAPGGLCAEAGLSPKFVHAANTGAVIAHPETWNTMVRPA